MKSRDKLYLLTTFIIMVLTGSLSAQAQMENPVRWNIRTVEDASERTVTLEMTASIDKGWHMYSNQIDPAVGPTPLSIDLKDAKGLKAVGELWVSEAPEHKFDDVFQADLSWWTGRVVLKRVFAVTAVSYT